MNEKIFQLIIIFAKQSKHALHFPPTPSTKNPEKTNSRCANWLPDLWTAHIMLSSVFFLFHAMPWNNLLSPSHPILDPYHAYRNLETNSLRDSNNINQNFSSQPYFDLSVARNVTTRVGQTAFLNCRVEQLGDKLVSFFMFHFHSFSDKNHIMSSTIFFNSVELLKLSIGCFVVSTTERQRKTHTCLLLSIPAGIVDTETRSSYIKHRFINVHIRREISGEFIISFIAPPPSSLDVLWQLLLLNA